MRSPQRTDRPEKRVHGCALASGGPERTSLVPRQPELARRTANGRSCSGQSTSTNSEVKQNTNRLSDEVKACRRETHPRGRCASTTRSRGSARRPAVAAITELEAAASQDPSTRLLRPPAPRRAGQPAQLRSVS